MLNLKSLTEELGRNNTNGVEHTMLLTYKGSLVASSDIGNKDPEMIACCAALMWKIYNNCAKVSFCREKLQLIIMDCDKGRFVIKKVATFLLCLSANKTVELGFLKEKITALCLSLDKELRRIKITDV